MRVMASTAHLPNRERDKQRVENSLGLPEFGDATSEFWAVRDYGYIPIALGYERIVYGDHGPYVEFSPEQICWDSFPTFIERPQGCYFDECYTADGMTMLYYQKRTVKNKANPPSGAWSVANNRSEGYANYVIGKLYVAAEADTIAVCCSNTKQRRRKRAGKAKKGKGEDGKGDGVPQSDLHIGSIAEEEGEDEESEDSTEEATRDMKEEPVDEHLPVMEDPGKDNSTIESNWPESNWDGSHWETGEAWRGPAWGNSWTESSSWWRQDYPETDNKWSGSRKQWAQKKSAEDQKQVAKMDVPDIHGVDSDAVVDRTVETLCPAVREMAIASSTDCVGKLTETTHATEGGA